MKKTRIFTAAAMLMTAACMQAQVSFMGTNNYFLNMLTDVGYASYDWHYDPLKTDREREGLKGNVVKMVMVTTDKTGRGYGENFVDTTYYNQQGNITRIGAPHRDPYNPQKKYRPDTWSYEYDANGKLKGYTQMTEAQMANGTKLQKHVHTMQRDARGNITQEIYRAYSQEGGTWKEFSGTDNVAWSFGYNANGALSSGSIRSNAFKLTYRNGQLTSILAPDFNKPTTFTYDAQGRMTGIRWFSREEFDDGVMCMDVSTTLSYNEKGDLIKAVEERWENTENWVRKSRESQKTYTITYIYDAQGNWTKAVMALKSNYGGSVENQPAVVTINRTFTYGKNEPATSGAGVSNQQGAGADVLEVVEKPAEFPGGIPAMQAYMAKNIHYPAEAEKTGMQGTVMLSFIVEKDGSITNATVIRSRGELLDNEALRVVKGMPKWTPGMQGGKPVRTKFTLPIPFKLN